MDANFGCPHTNIRGRRTRTNIVVTSWLTETPVPSSKKVQLITITKVK
jgi:hypothetical protein